jgi:hypothetical protein
VEETVEQIKALTTLLCKLVVAVEAVQVLTHQRPRMVEIQTRLQLVVLVTDEITQVLKVNVVLAVAAEV